MTDKTIEQNRKDIDQARKKGEYLDKQLSYLDKQLSKKEKELRLGNRIGLFLGIAALIAISSPVLFHLWVETPSRITKLELDIRMIVPNTNPLEKKDNKGRYIYTYEDDKILIHSSSNNQRYVTVPRKDHYFLPRDVNDKQATILDEEVITNVWIKDKEKLILVYHSDIDMRNQWRSPRSQDKFRSNLTYHKGKWVKYIQNLAKNKRKELDDIAEIYREKARQKRDEEKYAAAKKAIKEQARQKERQRARHKKEQAELQQEKDRLKRKTTPINDSHIFE